MLQARVYAEFFIINIKWQKVAKCWLIFIYMQNHKNPKRNHLDFLTYLPFQTKVYKISCFFSFTGSY